MVSRRNLVVLFSIVFISGLTQGVVLPLVSVLLKDAGLDSAKVGLNATAVYIGFFLVSPFLEVPLRAYGYRRLILIGGGVSILSTFFIPWTHSIWIWFGLRFLYGIFDYGMHFAIQTWLADSSLEDSRGRVLSVYGLCYGLGFGFGPLMLNLVESSTALPFILVSVLYLCAWVPFLFMKNEIPVHLEASIDLRLTLKRFGHVFKIAWIALLPPFIFGCLEASLSGNLPVFALERGFSLEVVSYALTGFAVGALVTQIPLGMLSDRFGRKKVIQSVFLLGSGCFLIIGLVSTHVTFIVAMLFVAGMLLGSTYSLGITYVTDLLSKNLIPVGTILAGLAYSAGCIFGPVLGGVSMEIFSEESFFYCIFAFLFVCSLLYYFEKPKTGV